MRKPLCFAFIFFLMTAYSFAYDYSMQPWNGSPQHQTWQNALDQANQMVDYPAPPNAQAGPLGMTGWLHQDEKPDPAVLAETQAGTLNGEEAYGIGINFESLEAMATDENGVLNETVFVMILTITLNHEYGHIFLNIRPDMPAYEYFHFMLLHCGDLQDLCDAISFIYYELAAMETVKHLCDLYNDEKQGLQDIEQAFENAGYPPFSVPDCDDVCRKV